MIKKSLSVLALLAAAASAQAAVILQEGFNNVPGLTSTGWLLNNASTPGGLTPGWFQGDTAQFSAHAGAANAYAAANYNNAPAGGLIDNWLITPEFSTAHDVYVSLWMRAGDDDGFSDHIAFGSSNGSGAIADFVMQSALTVAIGEWTKYTFIVNGNGAGSTARFAINYTGAADESNYVGVDTLQIAEIPEPSTVLILGTGLLGLVAARRRSRR